MSLCRVRRRGTSPSTEAMNGFTEAPKEIKTVKILQGKRGGNFEEAAVLAFRQAGVGDISAGVATYLSHWQILLKSLSYESHHPPL